MPELDYMLIADYVRQDASGVIHIMSAGIDTVFAPVVPTVQPMGIAVRLLFEASEPVGEPHRLTIAFLDADGQRLLQATSSFATPPQMAGVPPHWKTAAGIGMQIAVPLPRYGDYAFELNIDDTITRSRDLRVVRPPAASWPGGSAPV